MSHVLPERLNAEPPIFRGCGSSELLMLVTINVALWLPLSILVAWLMGALTMALGLAAVATVLGVMAGAGVLSRLKRNRPDGYYQQRFRCWLHDRRLVRSPFIRRSGHWDLGRSCALSPRD